MLRRSSLVYHVSFISSLLCLIVAEPFLFAILCMLDKLAGIKLQLIVMSRNPLFDMGVVIKPACKPILIVAAFLPGTEVSTS